MQNVKKKKSFWTAQMPGILPQMINITKLEILQHAPQIDN